jgi:hypothetical protein
LRDGALKITVDGFELPRGLESESIGVTSLRRHSGCRRHHCCHTKRRYRQSSPHVVTVLPHQTIGSRRTASCARVSCFRTF